MNAIQTYWTAQLGSTPEQTDAAGGTYDEDPTALPAILAPGGFADSSASNLSPFPNAIYGALASAGINALWNEDQDFIIKISDATLGQGAGAACKALPDMTYCDENGVAWIFMRWNWTPTVVGRETYMKLNSNDWQVWGAYPSPAKNPSGNSNNLAKYGLSLEVIAKSSYRVQQANGFWSKGTANETVSSVLANISNLTLDKIVSWNMAVCDLDALLNGKYFTPDTPTSVSFSKVLYSGQR